MFFFRQTAATTPQTNTPANPFGLVGERNVEETPSISTKNEDSNQQTSQVVLPKVEKIWASPVVGSSFEELTTIIFSTSTDKKGREVVIQNKATTSVLYFVQQSNGNIYRKNLDTGSTTRITNSTILGVHDAYFLYGGSYVAMRTYDKKRNEIQTFIASIPQGVSDTPLPLEKTFFLSDNIVSLATAYEGKGLYYLTRTTSGSSLYLWTKEKGSSLLGSYPLSELTLSVSKTKAFATTNASGYVEGQMFSLPELIPVYGDVTGLTTNTSPNGAMLIASMLSNTGPLTYFYNLSDGSSRNLKVITLAEKCAWNEASTFTMCGVNKDITEQQITTPDDWYQGAITYNDDLYIIGSSIKEETKLLELDTELKEKIDLVHPAIENNNRFLVFTNKRNGNLFLVYITRLFNEQ
jgi:hypothetical protein